jgi:hypothetical protein
MYYRVYLLDGRAASEGFNIVPAAKRHFCLRAAHFNYAILNAICSHTEHMRPSRLGDAGLMIPPPGMDVLWQSVSFN